MEPTADSKTPIRLRAVQNAASSTLTPPYGRYVPYNAAATIGGVVVSSPCAAATAHYGASLSRGGVIDNAYGNSVSWGAGDVAWVVEAGPVVMAKPTSVGSALTIGDLIGADGYGRAVAASPTTPAIGVALETVGTVPETVSVLLFGDPAPAAAAAVAGQLAEGLTIDGGEVS